MNGEQNPVGVAEVAGDALSVHLDSRYTVGELLRHSAHGRVHRARVRDGGEVAVDILRPDLAADPAVVAAFSAERDRLRSISHPNVVQVIDVLAEPGELAIVSQLVPGDDLHRCVQPPCSPAQALRLAAQVADGLAAVHAAGTVHGDLTPQNVFGEQEADGRLRLRVAGVAVNRLVARGSALGTPEYLAPEVGLGGQPTAASDVYGLGVVLYELCTGGQPFTASQPLALVMAHVNQPLPRPEGLPDPVWQLLCDLLDKNPERRPAAEQVGPRMRQVASGLEGLGQGNGSFWARAVEHTATPPAQDAPTPAQDAPTLVRETTAAGQSLQPAPAPPQEPGRRITVLPGTAVGSVPPPMRLETGAPRVAGFKPDGPMLGADLDRLVDERGRSRRSPRRLAALALATLAVGTGAVLGLMAWQGRDDSVAVVAQGPSAQPSSPPPSTAATLPSAGGAEPTPSQPPSTSGGLQGGVQGGRAPQHPGRPQLSITGAGLGKAVARVSGVQPTTGGVASVTITSQGRSVTVRRASGYSATFDKLLAGQTYSFTATVCNTEGLCSASTASYSPPKLPPGAPAVTVAESGEGQAVVTVTKVTPTTGTLSSITVSFGTGSVAVPVGNGKATSYRTTVVGLSAGKPYSFSARVCNSFALCASSGVVSYTPPKHPPGKPSLSAEGVGATQARLSVGGVSAGSGSVTSISIAYDGKTVSIPVVAGQSGYQTTVGALTAGKQYSFTATVCNSVGLCTTSDAATYTVPVPPPKVGTVTLTRAAMVVTVTWTATTAAPAGTTCTVEVVSTPAGSGLASRSIGLAAGKTTFTGKAKTSYQATKTCTYSGGQVQVKSSVLAIP